MAYYTNSIVRKVGENRLLSVMNAEVVNVGGQKGMIIFNRADETERKANIGKAPVINKTPSGKDAASCRVVLYNDANAINYGESIKVDETKNAKGDVPTYVTVQAYGLAAQDLARCAKVGGRISIQMGDLTVNEGKDGKAYATVTVGLKNQIQLGKKNSENAIPATEAKETDESVETPTTAEKAEVMSADENPFADIENQFPFD